MEEIKPVFARLLRVDAASTAATPDGSAAAPYPTIQEAIDATVTGDNSTYRVIRVASGTYATGESENSWGKARVIVPAKHVLLTSEQGPENTVIVGAPDPDADNGNLEWYDAGAGDKDVRGGQRVYNGAIDVGAFEYDWRPDYTAQVTDSRRLSVTAATPEVVSAEGGAYLPGGELTVTATDSRAAGGTQCELTAADGESALKFDTTGLSTDIVCAYTPGENETGGAYLSNVAVIDNMIIIFR